MTQEQETDNYKIIKLSNGEDIMGVAIECEDTYEVSNPLKIQVISKLSPRGMMESLNLSRWIQPFTEEEYVYINKHHIITMANASIGLSRYYDKILERLENMDEVVEQEEIHLPEDIMRRLEEEEPNKEEIYDELLEELNSKSKLVH